MIEILLVAWLIFKGGIFLIKWEREYEFRFDVSVKIQCDDNVCERANTASKRVNRPRRPVTHARGHLGAEMGSNGTPRSRAPRAVLVNPFWAATQQDSPYIGIVGT